MDGGPSYIDTWDLKPEREKKAGMTTGSGIGQGVVELLASPINFIPFDKSGFELSEIRPTIAKHADEKF